MHQSYCLICSLAAKEAHTFDLRFRHGLHAASVCLRFSHFDFGSVARCCVVAVDVGGSDDCEDDGGDSCKGSRELEGIARASMLPVKVAYPTVRFCEDCSILSVVDVLFDAGE